VRSEAASEQDRPWTGPARSFEDLLVWRKAHELVLKIYQVTQNFPAVVLYGLTSQLRRAAVSVPANIAEGFVKRGASDKARYMNIARGSLEEVHYYLILARDLGYADPSALLVGYEEVARLLSGYTKAIAGPCAGPG
jgi:four helix bundle protein